MSRTWLLRLSWLVIIVLVSAHAVVAEDIEKKWRLGFAFGGYNTQDDVESDSANSLFILDEDGLVERLLRDPRNDDAALGTLSIEPAPRFLGSVQYAVNKILVLEAAVGYQTGDVGDIEIQAQYRGVDIPQNRNFNFHITRIPAGTLEQIPIQLSAMARFRPRANFNPFLGGGVGYTIVGFEPSADLDAVSLRLDASLGSFGGLTNSGGLLDSSSSPIEDLEGAEVLAPDTVQWHLLGGAEYSFKRKWSAFVDLRYIFASRTFSLRFNGSDSLGVSVPNGAVDEGTPESFSQQYGTWGIPEGGIIDAGVLVPETPGNVPDGMSDEQYCAENPDCDFIFEPDGVPDPGAYYIKGGDIKYGGFHLGIGIRYTF